MHSGGGGYLSSKLESLTTGGPVHERRGHLNSQAVIFFRTRFPDPRSCTCISSPQPPATRPWHPSCAVRQRQDIRRPWLDSKVPSRTRVFSHIRYRHLLFPKSHLHTHTSKATSSVTRIPRVAMANRVMTSTPQQPGLPQVECAAKALIRYSDGATFSSSRGIIGIMGLSCLLPLVSPCPDGLVLAARSDHLAIGSPSDGIHLRGPVSLFLQSDWFTMHVVTYLVLVAWKIHGHVSCPHVPDFEGGVLASCDQEPAVRAPGALVDLCGGVRLGGSIKA